VSDATSGGVHLREYQTHNIEGIETALGRGEHVLYVLPTGGGKTVVATSITERAVERGERVLVLTHRREILRQTSLKLLIDHGLIQAGLNADLSYPVQIASVQTLWARCMRTDKLPLPAANLIIIDEAHHVRAQTWAKILEQYPNARRLGLSATPCRSDGRGLGNFFGTIVEGPQVAELIGQKHLVPTVYYAPVEPDLKGVKTSQGDYAINELADRMNRPDLVGDIVTNWHKHGERRKTLVFAVDVAHSIHIRDEFVKADVRAEHIDGSTPKDERDAILARLVSGETELVTNCMLLTEGFDLPAIGCIVLARPTKQLGLFRQMAGRGLRPAEGKERLVLIDHSGAVFRHGLLEDPIKWTLDTDKRAENPTHASRSTSVFSKLLECRQCGALRKGGEPCSHCGFQPKRRPEAILFADGELARVTNGKAKSVHHHPAELARWHAMLLWVAQERDYKPGWASFKYKEKFGVWPRWGSSPQPIPPSPEVSSWVRSRDIAYAKAREKAQKANAA
jgi:DNA repair protein RadD